MSLPSLEALYRHVSRQSKREKRQTVGGSCCVRHVAEISRSVKSCKKTQAASNSNARLRPVGSLRKIDVHHGEFVDGIAIEDTNGREEICFNIFQNDLFRPKNEL